MMMFKNKGNHIRCSYRAALFYLPVTQWEQEIQFDRPVRTYKRRGI